MRQSRIEETNNIAWRIAPAPDLVVSPSDIKFYSLTDPIKGDPITINATIHNSGEYPVLANQSFNVTFQYDGTVIGEDTITGVMRPGESKIATRLWDTTSVTPDEYMITVKADLPAPGTITERVEESNNRATKSIHIWSNCTDFIPLDISFSDESPYGYRETSSHGYSQNGQLISINVTIQNIGGIDNGTWVNISDLYNGTTVWSTEEYIDNVPGKGGTHFVVVSHRFNASGTHTIHVNVNPNHETPECNYSNNEMDTDCTVRLPKPELYLKYYYREDSEHSLEYIPEITFSNDFPIDGESIEIGETIYNNNFEHRNYATWEWVDPIAEYPAFDFNVSFYDSYNGAAELITTYHVSELLKGDSTEMQIPWTVTGEGWHTIKVYADKENILPEASGWEHNNFAQKAIYVWGNCSDLVPTEIWLTDDFPPETIFTNVSTDIHVTIKNQGGRDAEHFTVSFLDNGNPIGNITNVSCAGMDETVTLVFEDYVIPYAGPHLFTVVVDADDDIDECNETNNILDKTAFVHQPEPDLHILSNDITFWVNNTETDTAQIGQNVTIKVKVHNQGVVNTSNASIVFYVDLLERISLVMTIPYVPAQGYTMVETVWEVPVIVAPGYHAIYVLVEPNIYAHDPDPDDNMASRAILIAGHGDCVSVDVKPNTWAGTADETKQFTATCYDAYGNSWNVTNGPGIWSTTDPGGTVINGTYNPHTVGTWEVRYICPQGCTDYTNVTITVGSLHHLVIEYENRTEVDSIYMTVDDTVTVFARGYDADDNLIDDVLCNWTTTGSLDTQTSTETTTFTFDPMTPGSSGTIVANDTAGHTDETGLITVNMSNATIVWLRDSTGMGISDGVVTYYSSGWKDFGITDETGRAYKEIPPGTYTFRMTYGGTSIDKSQNIDTNNTVIFTTVNVTVKLLNSTGEGISDGVATYYASGWKTFGTTNTSGETTKELLPKSYTFKMTYAGTSIDKAQDISTNATVIFTTVNVTVKLLDSNGNGISDGEATYYASGWRPFGTTDENGETKKELLPKSYTFRMIYGGKSTDHVQDVSTNSTVIFTTSNVTVNLLDNNGKGISDGVVTYYSSGWKDFGITDETGRAYKEIPPGTYTFRMTYGGASIDKSQNIDTNNTVIFTTVNVTVKLLDSTGEGISDGVATYYASGWKAFGTTNTSGETTKELLPKSCTFRMIYGGSSNDQVQDISSDPVVVFQTGQVVSVSGNCTHYYASGWKTFIQNMELLPGSYLFRFNDGTPDTYFTVNASEINYIY